MGRRTLLVGLVAGAGALAPASGALALTAFVTPSGNIGCIGGRNEVRCDIRTTSATPPPRPAACDLEWGDAFAVRRTGRGRGVCHGDTVLPAPGQRVRVLAYGTSIRFRTLVCTSRATGLTCRNAGAHGLTLSRTRIRLF